MPSRRKYNGPCPEHAEKKSSCKHCGAYYMQQRYHGGTPPPAKKIDPTYRRPKNSSPIYRELHWPAPSV